jgi:hypothetical protein
MADIIEIRQKALDLALAYTEGGDYTDYEVVAKAKMYYDFIVSGSLPEPDKPKGQVLSLYEDDEE